MRSSPILHAAVLGLIACDTGKLGVEGATCSASSDCAGDLQCIQSTCVRPQAANAVRSAQVPAVPPVPATPPVAQPVPPAPPVPAVLPIPAATPVPAVPFVPPIAVPAPPPAPPTPPAPAGTTQANPRVPWLDRPANEPAPPTIPETKQPANTSSPLADPERWPVLDRDKDPWVTAVMTALRGIKIGVYAAQGGAMTYKFQLRVCPDGAMTAHRKGGTAGAQAMGVIENAIESLKPVKPPPEIRSQLAGACKKIPYVFTMQLKNGRTEIR